MCSASIPLRIPYAGLAHVFRYDLTAVTADDRGEKEKKLCGRARRSVFSGPVPVGRQDAHRPQAYGIVVERDVVCQNAYISMDGFKYFSING